MKNKLNYYIPKELDTEYHHWIIKFIIETIGLVPSFQKQVNHETHLIYGDNGSGNNLTAINIPHDPSDLINKAILNGDTNKQTLESFDIITAIGKFLTDVVNENKTADCYDAHNRLNSLDSYQREIGFQDKPIVNLYINFIKKIATETFKFDYTPLFPEGIKSVIILSHDVDDPVKYAMLNSYKLFPKNLSLKNFILYHMEAIKKSFERLIKKDENVFWVFDDVMNSESKYGFKSTFFFASRNRFNKHANFREDVPYDIEHNSFDIIFNQMNEFGFEVGLHASYYAKNNKEMLKEEIEKLERISNRKLVGNRHHFWQIGSHPEKTLQSHTQSGLVYDSSLAFNDAPGYRRNVALPYLLFDKELNQAINNMQIPTFMMDSNFMLNPEFREEEASNQAKHYINQLHSIGGVGAIDWHVRTSSTNSPRFKKWGEVYLQILEHLSKQEGIWVTNFETFHRWMMERNETLYNKT
jgi:peptidoglycan/xylan/chitin deacetylase (PgdA/CDA1 family)